MKKMETINGKVIYTPKGAALEYGRVGANFYTGCPHNCEYCYLKRGITGKALGGTEVKLKKCFKDADHAFEVFQREATRHLDYLRETCVFFSFTTDPLITETQDLTTQAVCWLNRYGIESWLLTKNATFFESLVFQSLIMGNPDIRKDLIHFGWTLTGRDDMEPNASTNADRLYAMHVMHHAGFPTWASIEPVIDWASTQRIVVASIPYCDHYKIGLRSGVKKDYYDWRTFEESLQTLVDMIVAAGRTVYLKYSIKKYVVNELGFDVKRYGSLLSKTVGMDGNPYGKED